MHDQRFMGVYRATLSLLAGKTRCQGYAFDGFNSLIEAFPST